MLVCLTLPCVFCGAWKRKTSSVNTKCEFRDVNVDDVENL